MRHFREHHLVLCLPVGAAPLRLPPHPEGIAPIGGAVYALLLFGIYRLTRQAPSVYCTPRN